MSNKNGCANILAKTFRILSDETRLRILMELQPGEMNVGQLCRRLEVAQSTVSHHLGILRMGELVTARREGKEIFYSVSAEAPVASDRAVRAWLKRDSTIRVGSMRIGVE